MAQKIKKSDLFLDSKLAPRWLADEFTVIETMMVEKVPAGSFVIVPACTKAGFEKTGTVKFDKRKKCSEVIVFVNPVNIPEKFKPRE